MGVVGLATERACRDDFYAIVMQICHQSQNCHALEPHGGFICMSLAFHELSRDLTTLRICWRMTKKQF
jgi:hypothetical protein